VRLVGWVPTSLSITDVVADPTTATTLLGRGDPPCVTRVCLLGEPDVDVRYELLSRETSRAALSTYDLAEPFENSIAVETVSLGAAVSLLNDLDWYIVRFVDAAVVLEPSVSDDEWLSRELATAIRSERVQPDGTGRFLKVYGVQAADGGEDAGDVAADGATGDPRTDEASPGGATGDESTADETDDGEAADGATAAVGGPPRLVEPMYVARSGGTVPEYDLRPVDDVVVVRVTEAEFGG
jgi:hypothetical protein